MPQYLLFSRHRSPYDGVDACCLGCADAVVSRVGHALPTVDDLGPGWDLSPVAHDRPGPHADLSDQLIGLVDIDESVVVEVGDAGPWSHDAQQALAFAAAARTSRTIDAEHVFENLTADTTVEAFARSILDGAPTHAPGTEALDVVVMPSEAASVSPIDLPETRADDRVHAARAIISGRGPGGMVSVQFAQLAACRDELVVLLWVATVTHPLASDETARLLTAMLHRLR